MNEQDFCARVLSQIRHATPEEKQAIARELSDHLEDHALALEEGGYPPELARERAVDAMGLPEEIGRELDRSYPLGWLMLSRAALIGTVLLGVMIALSLPMLGNFFNSFQARINPTRSNLEEDYRAQPLDIREELGNDVLRIYQVGLQTGSGDTGFAALAMCNYDRNPFGTASQTLLNHVSVTGTDGEECRSGGGGGNSGAYYWTARQIPVRRGEALTVAYDHYGERLELEIPLDWGETA